MQKKYRKEKINIVINKKQYDMFNQLINKYSSKYRDIMSQLQNSEKYNVEQFNLNNEIDAILIYNGVVKNILKELANEFKVFKKYNVTIFITGSFARMTNKISSDIDIHFLYCNIFKKLIWKYEELYFCIMASILNVERNNLHSVITTKLDNKKITIFDNNYDNKNLNINLMFNNKIIKNYLFYSTTKKRFFLQYDNNKSYHSFNKYIKKEIINENREWAHNFYPILNKEKFTKNYFKILNYEKANIKEIDLIKIIRLLRKRIIKKHIDNSDIKNIKKLYQQETLSNVFNVLCLFRNIDDIKYFNIDDIIKSKAFKKVNNYDNIVLHMYKYLWLLKRVSIYCNDNKISYSIHKSAKVDINFINEIIEMYIVIIDDLHYLLDYMEGLYAGKSSNNITTFT